MIKKVLQESFFYTFANYAPVLINIFTLPLITPYLTSYDYGVYGLVFAYTSGFSALSLLGYIVLFQNSYFKDKENFSQMWGKYIGMLNVWRIPFTLIVFIVLYFVFRDVVPGSELYLLLALVIVPILFFELTKTLGIRICQYSGNHKLVYIATIITSLLSIAITFVGVYFFKLGYIAWFISNFVTAFLLFIYYKIILLKKHHIKPIYNFSKSEVKQSLKVSLPLLPHFYTGYFIDSSDRLILDFYKTPMGDLGKYNLAYSFANYFKSFNDSMNNVLTPKYFSAIKQNNSEGNLFIKNITLLWFSFNLLAGFLLSLWLKEIFSFLYRNENLNSSYGYAILIIIGLSYQPIYTAAVSRIIYLEKSKKILTISLWSAIINLALNFILIPFFGIMASVFASFTSYLLMGFLGFFVNDIKRYIYETYPIYKMLLTITVVSIISLLVKDLNYIYKIPITVFIILSILFFWHYRGRTVYNAIKHIQ